MSTGGNFGGLYRAGVLYFSADYGPNLFARRLTDEQFLSVVINGGTLMPAWGLRLSPDDVWKVHAFVEAHPDGSHL